MKPSKIHEALDMAFAARKIGKTINPLLAGAAGIGKSEICQQWVKEQQKRNKDFQFIDLRIAYMEAPDLIGFPEKEVDANGLSRTAHLLPDFWPTDPNSEGLILLEEPNRGTTAVMNCLMQILTDRKVHKYELPPGWIIASAINPDSAEYDVNTMDTALRNRFAEFEVEYDHPTFCVYMEANKWHDTIQNFVKSGTWVYKDAVHLGKGAKYISPRTWSQMNAAMLTNVKANPSLHYDVCRAILGKDIGNEFYRFVHDDAPVTAQDLIRDVKKALKQLEKHCDKDNYQGDKIAITVDTIVKSYGGLEAKEDEVSEEVMTTVAKMIPSDQAVTLIKGCAMKAFKGNPADFFKEFTSRHPDLLDVLKGNIKLNQGKK